MKGNGVSFTSTDHTWMKEMVTVDRPQIAKDQKKEVPQMLQKHGVFSYEMAATVG